MVVEHWPKYQEEVFALGRQGLGYPMNPACGSADFFVPDPPRHLDIVRSVGSHVPARLREGSVSLDMKQRPDASASQAVTTESLTPDERRQFDDIQWADADPQVIDQYRGEFVVPYLRRIVAHGHDLDQVLAEGARATGRKPEELPVVAVDDSFPDVTSY